MTDKTKPTKAGAIELSEEELAQAQGGTIKFDDIDGRNKKADKVQPKTTNFSFGVERE